MLLCSIYVSAHDFEVDGIYYNILSIDDSSVSVTYRDKNHELGNTSYSTKKIVIPEKVTYKNLEYTVTEIGPYAFKRSEIKKITLPETINKIREYSFYDCDSLTSIKIPNSVNYIGERAFGSCYELSSINVPDGVTHVGAYAFSYCSNLMNIYGFENVTSMGRDVFEYTKFEKTYPYNSIMYVGNALYKYKVNYDKEYVRDISIANGTKCIADYAFNKYESSNRWQTLIIPGSVETIGKYAFYGVDCIEKLYLNNGIKRIEESAFYNSFANTNTDLSIPNSIEYLGERAFAQNTWLTNITFGEGLEYVSSDAFQNTPFQKNQKGVVYAGHVAYAYNKSNKFIDGKWQDVCESTVEFKEGTTIIQENILANENDVNCLIIPTTVKKIGANAFKDCRLSKIIMGPKYVPDGCESAFTETNKPRVTFVNSDNFYLIDVLGTKHYAVDNLFTYQDCLYAVTSAAGRTCALINMDPNREHSEIEIPSTVIYEGNIELKPTEIKPNAFCGNTQLTSIVIPNSIFGIGDNAFSECTSLKSIKSYNNVPPVCYSETFADVNKSKCIVEIPFGSLNEYIRATGWNAFFNIKEFNTTNIKEIGRTPIVSFDIKRGQLTISAPVGTHITVYDMNGKQKLFSTQKDEVSQYYILDKGIYILCIGETKYKFCNH